ncbi:MAG: sialate O-acetylesterase [Microscillaceae bacterium]|nr:sialate O-acetylesterase [Microscillaceae bacterium]
MKLNKLIFLLLFISTQALCQVKLPKLISDRMVLQRDTQLKIWGWAAAKENIQLTFRNQTYKTQANEAGEWMLQLPPQKAGGPFALEIKASNTLTIQDVLLGDVWLCSGQSNMELPIRRVKPLYEKEISQASYDQIRYFAVPQKYDFNTPQKDLEAGQWQKTNPQTVLGFSAVAYFFAKELYEKYQIPIGLINSSLGGSPAEAWMSEEALKNFPKHYEEALKFRDKTLITQIEDEDRKRSQTWYKQLNEKDRGLHSSPRWNAPELHTAHWETMIVPGYWAETPYGTINGAVWFRKEINIPASMVGQTAKLNLGRIVDADSVFVNGQFVGTTSYQYPPRWYEIPASVLKEGKNTISIRIINERGNGGFVLDKPYELSVGAQSIDLKGVWLFKLGAKMDPLASQTFIRWKPLGLFNAMIHPLLNFGIKGAIWYQGESNASRPTEYQTLFPAMIQDWRNQFQQGDFPFLFVQLANFMEAKDQPSESDWAKLREAQLKTLSLPKTGMAVSTDIGEWNDIHPLNKKDVGHRLALAAQKIAYKDEKTVHSGPIYEAMKIEKGKITLTFTNTGSGLTAKGGKALKHFAIAGADRKFVWAQAKIIGNQVIVWHEDIPNPVAVRYAWADNPEGANLYNQEGLPATPFRTDAF